MSSDAEKKIKVGLCHGVFDLLHVGHIEHFREAASQVDKLVVSITADGYVRKPGRPYFSHLHRKKVLEALEMVDEVIVTNDATALPAIESVRPDYYFKGADYAGQTSDENLNSEISLASAIDCEVRFTRSHKFSSTAVFRNLRSPFSSEFRAWLTQNLTFDQVLEGRKVFLERAGHCVVIGDAILDWFHLCELVGFSGKNASLSYRESSSVSIWGGAVAAARHALPFFENTQLAAAFPASFRDLADFPPGLEVVQPSSFGRQISLPVKKKWLSSATGELLLSMYEEIEANAPQLEKLGFGSNAFQIIMDFGHGFLNDDLLKGLLTSRGFTAVNSQLNSEPRVAHDVSVFRGANLLSFNRREVSWHLGVPDKDAELQASKLRNSAGVEHLLITMGAEGMLLCNSDGEFRCPSMGIPPVDRIGMGDAALVAAAIALERGLSPELVLLFASISATVNGEALGNLQSLSPSATDRVLEDVFACF